MGRWLMNKLWSKSWLTIILLLAAIGSVTSALVSSIPILRNAPLLNYMLFGIAAGWLLAKTRLRGWWALPLGLASGAGAILFGYGSLGPPLLSIARGSLIYVYGLVSWLVQLPWKRGVFPSGESLQLAAQEISTSVSLVVYRVYSWLTIGLHGHWMVDVLATAILWSVIVCLCALWAAWMARAARNPILGVAPAGLLMAFVLNYTRASSLIVVGFLASALLLMILNMEISNEDHWKKGKIDFAEHIPQDVAITGVVLTVIFVLLASGAHAAEGLTFKDITNFFDRFRADTSAAGKGGDTLAESMGIEPPAKNVSTFSQYNQSSLPRQHLLGSGPELSKRVVMVVQPDQNSLNIQNAGNAQAFTPHFYWRALTYDNYNGHGWTANDIQEGKYKPDTPLVASLPGGWLPFHASVRGVEDLANLLYYTGDLVNADKDYLVAQRPIYQVERGQLPVQTYIQNDVFGARIEAQNYQFDSILSIASENSLRNSTSTYPDWIVSRYLKLPDITPSRLFMLAISLTDHQTEPYEKALAIQNYLRTIPYSLEVPTPPADRDVADYFVFDLEKGYCDYYATAMVVMARAIGIPSRLVMGYASGTYDPQSKSFVVTEADAHSWPELYFQDIGWVEFEPTASLPTIQRPTELTPEQIQQAVQQTSRIRFQVPSWTDILVRTGLTLLVLYVIIDLWSAIDILRLRRLGPQDGIRRIYQRLYRQARPLVGASQPGDTPLEYSAELQNRILALKNKQHDEPSLNLIIERVRVLTGLYIQVLFSPHTPAKTDFEQAIQFWKRLRRELFTLRLRRMMVRKKEINPLHGPEAGR